MLDRPAHIYYICTHNYVYSYIHARNSPCMSCLMTASGVKTPKYDIYPQNVSMEELYTHTELYPKKRKNISPCPHAQI